MILEFKARKRGSTNDCDKGYPCGESCISRKHRCRGALEGQASSYAGWLSLQAAKTTKAKDTPLTDAERSQPKKLIELGKKFVNEQIDVRKVSQQILDYDGAKSAHYDRESERISPLLDKKKELIGRLNTAAEKGLRKEYEQELAEIRKLEPELEIRAFDKIEKLKNKQLDILEDKSLSPDELHEKLYASAFELGVEKNKLPYNKTLQKLKTAIADRSPIGITKAKEIIDEKFDIDNNTDYSSIVNNEARVTNDFAEIIQLSGDEPIKVSLTRRDDRPSAVQEGELVGWDENDNTIIKHRKSTINVGSGYESMSALSAKSDMYHEYSHTVEFRNPEIARANSQWVRDRSTSDTPQKLNDLVKEVRYNDHEIAYPDSFITPYVGKEYDSGSGSTEVLSVGAEHFSSPFLMKELLTADPEHFYLTVGTFLATQDKKRQGNT